MPITRSGLLLRAIREQRGLSRATFRSRYSLFWSEETQKNWEDGTTLINDDGIQQLLKEGVFSPGSPQHETLVEALDMDRKYKAQRRRYGAIEIPTLDAFLSSTEWDSSSVASDLSFLNENYVSISNTVQVEADSNVVWPSQPKYSPPQEVYPEPLPDSDSEPDFIVRIVRGPIAVVIYRYMKSLISKFRDDLVGNQLSFSSFYARKDDGEGLGLSIAIGARRSVTKMIGSLLDLDDVYYGRKTIDSER